MNKDYRDMSELTVDLAGRLKDVSAGVRRFLINVGLKEDIKLPYKGMLKLKSEKDNFKVYIYEVDNHKVNIYEETAQKHPVGLIDLCICIDQAFDKYRHAKRMVRNVYLSDENLEREIKEIGVPAKVSKNALVLGNNELFKKNPQAIRDALNMHVICCLCNNAVELKDWVNTHDCIIDGRLKMLFDELYNEIRAGKGEGIIDRVLGNARNEYYKYIMKDVTTKQNEAQAWDTLAKYSGQIEDCASGKDLTFAKRGKSYFENTNEVPTVNSDYHAIIDRMIWGDFLHKYQEPVETREEFKEEVLNFKQEPKSHCRVYINGTKVSKGSDNQKLQKPNPAPHEGGLIGPCEHEPIAPHEGGRPSDIYVNITRVGEGIIPPQAGDPIDMT